jgi:NTE family protein
VQRIGLALGGGGAKGIAHIVILELLDEMGIRPHRISGTSIGAVIGAMYASGMSGADIRGVIKRMTISEGDSIADVLLRKDLLKWIDLVDINFGRTGLLHGEKVMKYLYEMMKTESFEELEIPLKVVAADFWTRETVVISSGPLLPAVKASMAIPGVFTPVKLDGRVLIDGGGVDPVPYEWLLDECDVTVAVDVMGDLTEGRLPGFLDIVLTTFDVMQDSIIAEKLKRRPPDIYIRPRIMDVKILEFDKAERVLHAAIPAKEELREKLTALI